MKIDNYFCKHLRCSPLNQILFQDPKHVDKVVDMDTYSKFRRNLLLISGDIEMNPGPMAKSLNIFHHNINSLAPKIHEIVPELEDFDVAIFTETKLDCSIQNDKLEIPDFQTVIRKDRNRNGGGVAVYIETFYITKEE